MKLSVLGEPQALPTAAYASLNSGQEVGLGLSAVQGISGADQLAEAELEGSLSPIRVRDGILPETELFVVVSESADLEQMLYHFRNQLAGKTLLLAPGGFAGALRASSFFAAWDLPAPRIAEVTGFIVGGAASGQSVKLGTIKRNLPLAVASPDETQEILAEYLPYFPDLVASDLITTSLSNTNHMIHPGVVLLNAARIDGGESFRFYREGLSPVVADYLQGIDEERLAIVRALSAEELDLRGWMLRFYADQGMHGNNVVECLQSFPRFADVPSPPRLNYRYLTDDVAHGVAHYLAVARLIGTPCESLQSLVSSIRLICGQAVPHTGEPAVDLFMNYSLQGTGVGQ